MLVLEIEQRGTRRVNPWHCRNAAQLAIETLRVSCFMAEEKQGALDKKSHDQPKVSAN
jgi:hypothetical protein